MADDSPVDCGSTPSCCSASGDELVRWSRRSTICFDGAAQAREPGSDRLRGLQAGRIRVVLDNLSSRPPRRSADCNRPHAAVRRRTSYRRRIVRTPLSPHRTFICPPNEARCGKPMAFSEQNSRRLLHCSFGFSILLQLPSVLALQLSGSAAPLLKRIRTSERPQRCNGRFPDRSTEFHS
jgi:hypothetical protein